MEENIHSLRRQYKKLATMSPAGYDMYITHMYLCYAQALMQQGAMQPMRELHVQVVRNKFYEFTLY